MTHWNKGPTRHRKGICVWVLLTALLPRMTRAQEPAETETAVPVVPLDQLVAEAAASYPAIQAEWAEVEAMRQREAQVTQPADPMLMVGALNVPWQISFTEDPMTGVMLGVSQDFYWPGVLDTRGAEARAQVAAMAEEVPEMAVMLWMETVESYHMVVEADRMAEVLAVRRTVLVTLADAMRAAYEARMATLADAMRVNAEITGIDLELAEVRRDRRTMAADLNGMLNRPATTPLVVETDVDWEAAERAAEEWLALAIENRPAFRALRAQHEWISARQDVAETMDDPMWNAALGWMFRFQEGDTGMDMVNLELGISLPFFSARRVDAELAELEVQSYRVDLQQEELLRALRAEIGMRLEAMASLREELAILEGELIPSVEAMYESAGVHYEASHDAVEPLIEIQDQLLMLEMTRVEIVTAYDRHRASLRALCGDSDALRQISWRQP